MPFIWRMLRQFYQEQGGIYGIPVDMVSAVRFIERVRNTGICIVGLNSCAGALLNPFPFNHAVIVAHVTFWKFKTAREIRILDVMMDACKSAGATHVSAASQFPHNRIQRYYARKGLHKVEELAMRAFVNVTNPTPEAE